MDELQIFSPILLVIIAGALLYLIVPFGDIPSDNRKHWIHSIDHFHCGRPL